MSPCKPLYDRRHFAPRRPLREATVAGRLGAAVLLGFAVLAGCAVRPVPAPVVEAPFAVPPRAWSTSAIGGLRSAAEMAAAHGLRSEEETIEALDRLDRSSERDAAAARELDLVADDLFERLTLAFSIGVVNTAEVDPEWFVPRAAAPDMEALRRSVADGASPAAVLASLLPTSPEYGALVAELARVRAEPAGATSAEGLSREARVERLRANLERWRWLPRAMPARRIDALVPFFELRLRGGAEDIAHPIIVGARRTPTPTFVAAIESITLNPTWTPPSSIADGELLPRFRRDTGAAAREGFDVLNNAGGIVDPADVDWRARPFPYTLRQRSGPGNALGRLRFDLPNPHAIYLHDTPSRELFARADRALSHGCIRVAEPVQLAANVLLDAAWDVSALEAAIETGAGQTLPLSTPLPIYILYLTAASDRSGAVAYSEDIYGRDAAVLRALDRAPVATRQSAHDLSRLTECSRASGKPELVTGNVR